MSTDQDVAALTEMLSDELTPAQMVRVITDAMGHLSSERKRDLIRVLARQLVQGMRGYAGEKSTASDVLFNIAAGMNSSAAIPRSSTGCALAEISGGREIDE